MENATKALIMAAGVLISLIIISLLLLMFGNINSYQRTNQDDIREAQTLEFNNQFITFDRNDVRGSDIVSLMNKIIDYNTRKIEDGYTEMGISISINNRDKLKYGENNMLIKQNNYNQSNISSGFMSEVKRIEEDSDYRIGSKDNISVLTSNISSVMTSKEEAQKYIKKTITNYDKLKNDVCKYYEYTQLKRTYFDCTKVEYDNNTGRITKMEFKSNGKLE